MAGPGLPETIVPSGNPGATPGHPTHSEKAWTILNRMDLDDLPTTKGDLYVFDGTTMRRLGVGTDDQVLTADAAQTLGVKWAAATGGGGGGATPLAPDEITNLAGWWDASQIVGLSDGDPVSTWPDLSGNAVDFTQATAGNRPTYQTNEINGLAVVRFDATDDGMEGGADLTNPFSIFYVVRTPTTTGNRRAIQGNVNNWLVGPYGGTWQWYSGGFATALNAIVANQTVIHGVVQTASVGWHFLWATSATATFPAGATDLTFESRSTPGHIGQMALGAAGAFAEPLDGDIGEIAVYSRALTQDEGDGLVAHLATKWGL